METTVLTITTGAREVVHDLTGERKARERGVLRAVTSVADADTLEAVLLYHVVPGATITY